MAEVDTKHKTDYWSLRVARFIPHRICPKALAWLHRFEVIVRCRRGELDILQDLPGDLWRSGLVLSDQSSEPAKVGIVRRVLRGNEINVNCGH